MASPATLPLANIVNVVVQVAPQAPPSPTFNQGLIVGPSPVIPSIGGPNPRIRLYFNLAGMLSDGFTTSMPEYISAQMYFGQQPAPTSVFIGRQDLTALGTISIGASGGTGYVVGDVLTVVQAGASGGTISVATIGGGGTITGVTIKTGGTGYQIANNLPTTGGTGSGAQINIIGTGETPLIALQACRTANPNWWACMVTTAAAADHLAIAAFVQAVTPVACYFFTTSDVAVLNGTAGNVLANIKAASYNRTFGVYSTIQGGLAPNNLYAVAASMGVAMGLNTGLANSAFSMKFKVLAGVVAEPLTATSIGIIEGNNGNVYLSYGNAYTFIEQGTVGNGQFLDEILNLDMLSSNIQFNVMNVLVGSPKIPQTDAGQTQLIHAVNQACQTAFLIGFIGPGTWSGVQILTLVAGMPLPQGYLVQSDRYANQSQANRVARQSMPIYVAITEAGAVHSVLIGVYVQR